MPDYHLAEAAEALQGVVYEAVPLQPDHSRHGLLRKRVIDVTFAVLLLMLVAPVMVVVALAIKCDGPGEIFYRQERVGLKGRRFTLFKFRSMLLNAEWDNRPVWTAKK